MRSDLTFVDEVATALKEAGVDDAAGIAHAVLTQPTVAARRSGPDGAVVLQSAVLEGTDEDFAVQVVVRLQIRDGKPGTAGLIAVEQQPVDLDDPADLRMLVAAVEEWFTEFPMPNVSHPEPLPLRPWAWLGDPTHIGLRDTPANWRDLVTRVGGVHGVAPLVVDTAERLRTWKVGDRVEHAVILRGTKWAVDFPPEGAAKEVELTHQGLYGASFDEVLDTVRADLLSEALASNAPTPASRDLDAGEIVYHRKVGDSRKFDRFDAGSGDPCPHGPDGFVGWNGEKAIKGMARRYDNFTPAMLVHCGKYPNCGMYGVDAARGGLKPVN